MNLMGGYSTWQNSANWETAWYFSGVAVAILEFSAAQFCEFVVLKRRRGSVRYSVVRKEGSKMKINSREGNRMTVVVRPS